ncbi:hypothetical protein M514_03208 [Trichuris suis]|uniref:Uncharacterized protein n=1 Tax=Trichuris suis TaxID=68888 RepID=A0A085MFT8_9BILA|nr:hypothetical protein M513_03208 [Trichuris suis]KFD66031.1 hypothetical protein M514_03208 [Trichuris suis]
MACKHSLVAKTCSTLRFVLKCSTVWDKKQPTSTKRVFYEKISSRHFRSISKLLNQTRLFSKLKTSSERGRTRRFCVTAKIDNACSREMNTNSLRFCISNVPNLEGAFTGLRKFSATKKNCDFRLQ